MQWKALGTVATVALLAGCAADDATSSPASELGAVRQAVELAPLQPVADTTLRLAMPYANDGTGTRLGVTSASIVDLERALIKFDTGAITAAVGGQSLYSARLELTVDSISAGWLGGQIEARRMIRDWPEGNGLLGHGPSWVCADDTNTTFFGNFFNNCSAGDAWGMQPSDPAPEPYTTPATSRAFIFTGGVSVVTLDVTRDVQAFLNGTDNFGWLLSGLTTPASGDWVNFGSRESGNPPALVLDVGPDQCLTDPDKGAPGQCGCGVPDIDANFDGVADCFDSVVSATGDTTVRLAAPFANDGTGELLGVTSASIAGLERSLIQFDQATIDAAVDGRDVEAAYLQLTVAGIAAGWGGGNIEIHPMNRAWPEGTGLAGHGPSWYCADDRNTTLLGNLVNDCPPQDLWGMEPWQLLPIPFTDPPTDSQPLFTLSTRSVRFDVTDDVRRFVDGEPNYGWIVKGEEGLLDGEWINFGSRESGAPPQLLLELSPICPPGTDGDPDNDQVPTCFDECPFDGTKSERGLCNCGALEVDRDDDKVPDCRDACPDDPNNSRAGTCRCSDDPASPGTPCSDGICPGDHECDGAGVCGDPSSCAPAAGCVARQFEDSWYWFCTGSFSWDDADAACRAVQGRSLVQIDSADENTFLRAASGVQAWTGANDRSEDGTWRWSTSTTEDGPAFWTGGTTGEIVDFRYAHWADAAPDGQSAENCAQLDPATGRWVDAPCGDGVGFICEQSRLVLDGTDRPRTCFGRVVPGLPCPSYPQKSPQCVPEEDSDFAHPTEARAYTEAEFKALADACTAGCTDPNNRPACEAACQGPVAPPGPTATCTPDTDELLSCQPKAVQSPTTECGADPNNPHQECDTANGYYCLHFTIDFATFSFSECRLCDEQVLNPDTGELECVKDCSQVRSFTVCAQPSEDCEDWGGECSEQEICTDPEDEWTTDDPRYEPGSDLETEPFVPTEFFGPEPEPPSPSDPWADESEAPCNASPCAEDDPTHNWCHYDVDETLTPQTVDRTKHGESGRGKALRFDFDPNLVLDYKTDPGPLGITTGLDLHAEASLRAAAAFDLLGTSGTVEIVDIAAILKANRCRVWATESRFEVLGIDFISLLSSGEKEYFPFDTDVGDGAEPEIISAADCEAAYDRFQILTDRAKKAFKDTQELIRQYKAAAEMVPPKSLPDTLWTDLDLQAPEDFVAPTGPEPPEDTINRFAAYYRDQVADLRAEAGALAGDVLNYSSPEYELLGFERDETQLIASVNFAIGPIPMNLEIESVVFYGVDLKANLEFRPGDVVNTLINSTNNVDSRSTLAFVNAEGEPFAGTAVRLFVGAGFSVPGFTAKAGVEGEITLGTISAPLYAGAGIGLAAQEDPRDIPADLAALQAVSGGKKSAAIHPKQYEFFLKYTFGSNVEIRNLLRGSLSAKVKLKFLFFSKSWKKVLVTFDGWCNEDDGAPAEAFCDIPLFHKEGNPGVAASDLFGWGTIRMPMPFVDIADLAVNPNPPTDIEPVTQDRAGLFFYDSQCTCIGAPGPDVPECHRDDDCCDLGPGEEICFRNYDNNNERECSLCRGKGQTCEENSDCCTNVAPVPGEPACWQPLTGGPQCGCLDDGRACRRTEECCSGALCSGGVCVRVK